MELNGIANILALIEMAKWDNRIDESTYKEIHEQCDILERYLVAVGDSMRKKGTVPKWHDVREFRHKYRLNKQG